MSSDEALWPSSFSWKHSGGSGEGVHCCPKSYSGRGQHCIVLAAAEGIVTATDWSLLQQHRGTLVLTKSWAKSLLIRRGLLSAKALTQQNWQLLSLKSVRNSTYWTYALK